MAQDRYGQFGGDWRYRDDRDYSGRGQQDGREDFGRGGERRAFGPGQDAWGPDERGGVGMGHRDVGGYFGFDDDRDRYDRRGREGAFAGADYRGVAGREPGGSYGRVEQRHLGPDERAAPAHHGAPSAHPRQGEHRGHGPKGYRRSDERIREDVCDRLTDDSHLDARMIEVEVKSGDVILHGTVGRREDKRRAEILAERCSGVENVQNNLRARSQGEGARPSGGQAGEGWGSRPSPG